MSDEPSGAGTRPGPREKKPYHRPALEVHGTIREVTAHVGNASSRPDPPPYASFKFTTH
jgi:hypothetical protein